MNPISSYTTKLIGTPLIEERKGGYYITQKVEVKGKERIISIHLEKKVGANEAIKLCQEKLKELSQTFESERDEKILKRNLVKQEITNDNSGIGLISSKSDPTIPVSLLKTAEISGKVGEMKPLVDNLNPIISLDEKVLDINLKTEITKSDMASTVSVDQNKLIYNLMLDKLFINEQKDYESTSMEHSASMLLHGIKQLESILKPFKNSLNEKKGLALCEKFKKNFNQFISICQSGKDEKLVSMISNEIHNLKIDDSFLIPCGIKNHATAMLFTKTGEKTFQITLYNTGKGVNFHHKLSPQSLKYQTFETIINVPQESINLPALLSLLQILYLEPDPLALYVCFINKLAAGGTKLPPSEHEEDYETIQSTGTCTTQSLMAFLRHQVMLAYEGTPSEKLAFYKTLKNKMFIRYYEENLNNVDKVIEKHLATKISKLLGESKTEEISRDKERFDEAFIKITSLLKEIGEEKLVESLEEKNKSAQTELSRYALLHLASTKLSIAWLKNPSKFSYDHLEKEECFQLALSKFQHYSMMVENYDLALSQAKNFDESMRLVTWMLRKPHLQNNVIKKIISICKSDKELAEKIFNKLKEDAEAYQPFIEEILEQLGKDQHPNKDFFENLWYW